MSSQLFFSAKPCNFAACAAWRVLVATLPQELSTGDAGKEGVKSVLESGLSDSGNLASYWFQIMIQGRFPIIGG